MKFCLIRALPFIALLLSFCSLLAAQETKKSSAVTVEVTDVSRAVVPNVQIKFVSLESAEAKTLATDDAGKVLLELEPGSYDMIVTSRVFRTLKRRINVNAGESQKFELVLQIGGCPPGPCLEVTSPQSIVEQGHSDTKDIDIDPGTKSDRASQAALAAQAPKPHRVRVKEDVQKAKLIHGLSCVPAH